MIKVLETENFVIIDNFISRKSFTTLWNFFQSENFEFIQSKEWVKINRLQDGNALYSEPFFSDSIIGIDLDRIYPTKTGIDILFSQINRNLKYLSKWTGTKGRNWSHYFGRGYLYPINTGLSWHDDFTEITAAYIFYVNPIWNIQWGGELLVADEKTKDIKRSKKPIDAKGTKKFLGPYLDNCDENQQILERGYGHYILPKPNRFVILKSGIIHSVKKVDQSAGDNCRCSFAGFFINKNKSDNRFE